MGWPNPDVGGIQECTQVLKARGVSAPGANSAVTMDSEHSSALDGLSQKKKWENTKNIKQISQEWIYKVWWVKSESHVPLTFSIQKI